MKYNDVPYKIDRSILGCHRCVFTTNKGSRCRVMDDRAKYKYKKNKLGKDYVIMQDIRDVLTLCHNGTKGTWKEGQEYPPKKMKFLQ